MITVKDQWEEYRKTVVAADAGPIQIAETEQAFYSGAMAIMAMQIQAIGTQTEEEAVHSNEYWFQEIQRFIMALLEANSDLDSTTQTQH